MAYTNIDDPSAYFTTTLWTGAGGSPRAITNDANSGDFQPDFIWTKGRNEAYEHQLYDSSRGAGTTKGLTSNDTNAEGHYSATYGYMSAINSNGFTGTAGTSGQNAYFDTNAKTYVAWQWKCNGGTTSSNTVGTITSTVQANTTAGFSIYTYTGTGAAGTVGHGLGGLPEMIILKGRNTTSDWPVYIDPQKDGTLQFPKLNGTEANIGNSPFTWDTTKFTFSSGSGYSNTSGTNYIAYAFRSIQGYSKIGSYVGNGNANGTFVYTGFKPAMVITKKISDTGNWTIYDNKRDPFNVADTVLLPNATNADQTVINFDFVSNGFKCRNSGSENESGTTYIYIAFAENPFTTSTGIPTTAR